MRIGVLALQGDFIEHRKALEELGVESPEIRLPGQLEGLHGLIIPGGESTTIGKLAVAYGLVEPIRRRVASGWPVWGTCAGMILLARDIGDLAQPLVGLMDITVRRNAFGRQVDSFEADLDIAAIGGLPVRAVFIRAPFVTEIRGDAEALATLDNGVIVLVRQGSLLAAAFHPELTEDARVHEYFVEMARAGRPTFAPPPRPPGRA